MYVHVYVWHFNTQEPLHTWNIHTHSFSSFAKPIALYCIFIIHSVNTRILTVSIQRKCDKSDQTDRSDQLDQLDQSDQSDQRVRPVTSDTWLVDNKVTSEVNDWLWPTCRCHGKSLSVSWRSNLCLCWHLTYVVFFSLSFLSFFFLSFFFFSFR